MGKKGSQKQTKAPITPPKKILSGKKAFSGNVYVAAIILITIIISIIRAGLLDVPLERDEGEYSYFGKLLLEGVAPYKIAYNMKLPGTYAMYSLFMVVFGTNASGVHIGLLVMNAATMLFFFFGFRKLFNDPVALVASSVYGLMAMSSVFLGLAAHATHFVNLFVSIGILFLANYYNNGKLKFVFLTGLAFGVSFLMKQQAVFFMLFGAVGILLPVIMQRTRSIKNIFLNGVIYSAGAIGPYILTVLLLMLVGAFDKFWFWTVEYASKYTGNVTFLKGMESFITVFTPMWEEFGFFWVLFFAGIILAGFSKLSAKQKLIAWFFALFAFLSICPGLHFRRHYFISILPSVGLLAGIAVYYFQTLLSRFMKVNYAALLPFLLLIIAGVSVLTSRKEYYFSKDPAEVSRNVYGLNPFIESVEIAKYLEANSEPNDKVAIIGSEPQIFFYANRRSATGYIYTYALVEIHDYNLKMQEEMIAEIEKNNPKYIVYCNVSTSWLAQPGAPQLIFQWANKYTQQGYELTGVADIIDFNQTVYKWGNDARTYQRKGSEYLLIFKRRS